MPKNLVLPEESRSGLFHQGMCCLLERLDLGEKGYDTISQELVFNHVMCAGDVPARPGSRALVPKVRAFEVGAARPIPS